MSQANYADAEGMREYVYAFMRKASALKSPSLPTKPLHVTSWRNGRAYVAAGQARVALHTMAVMQAYQVDLLKDLDQREGLP